MAFQMEKAAKTGDLGVVEKLVASAEKQFLALKHAITKELLM